MHDDYFLFCRPYTEETLIELGASGVKNLVVVPVSFVSEHIETLVRLKCYVMICNVMLCYVMFCYVMLCLIMS